LLLKGFRDFGFMIRTAKEGRPDDESIDELQDN
jgi:hypothetical protein